MSEKECLSQSQGGVEHPISQKNGHFQNMSEKDILIELETKMDEMTDLNYDGEVIDAYLAALEEKKFTKTDLSKTKSWEEFRSEHTEFFRDNDTKNTGPKKAKQRRASYHRMFPRIVAAAAVVVVLSMVCAQAAGFNFLGVIGRWTKEIFGFQSDPGNVAVNDLDANETVYREIKAALKGYGITEDIVPQWYPEGFEATPPEIQSSDMGDTLLCCFTGKNDEFLMIKIMRYNNPSNINVYTFEKEDVEAEKYISNGRLFYVLSNLKNVAATWSDGNELMINITGNISADDIKMVIDSIGG